MNPIERVGGTECIREKKTGHHTFSPSIRHTHTHTAHFLGPGSGGFEVTSLLLLIVPVKHETRLFPHAHRYAHTHKLPLGCHSGHTQTTCNKGLASALQGLQVMSGPALNRTHRHIYALPLDLYSVLHPPLNAAVTAFLNSYRSTVFKEFLVYTHKHTVESFRDFQVDLIISRLASKGLFKHMLAHCLKTQHGSRPL